MFPGPSWLLSPPGFSVVVAIATAAIVAMMYQELSACVDAETTGHEAADAPALVELQSGFKYNLIPLWSKASASINTSTNTNTSSLVACEARVKLV